MTQPPDRPSSELPTLPPANGGCANLGTSPSSPAEENAAARSEAATLAPPVPVASEACTLPPGPDTGEKAEAASRKWVVPGYEVLGELGKGGMGVVYQARQTALGRTVALKMILHADHAGDTERERFRIEAQAVARLQHPHIVQVFEVGEHDGLPYFSLEFCPGGSLADQLDGTPWEAKRAAKLVETLARAMQAAHQAQVIHRDLKPANVLLTADGQPKITDFGLAKKLDEQGKTQTGAIMGTPSYMAPEQAGGKSGAIGPAADVYALGGILYELLTGRPPFKAATPLDTVLQVISDEPVPPRQLQSNCPPDLETITLKCLQKEPGKRYASAVVLAEDLRRFVAGEPIVARPVGRGERAWRWCRRNPAVAGLLLAASLFLVAGVAGVAWFAVEASRQAREAEESARQATAEKVRANEESERASRNELNALRNLYLSQMGQAHLAWKEGQVGRVLDLLDAQEPGRNGGHDFRGFEWYYLRRLCRASHRILARQPQAFRAVAFRPDGKLVASVSGHLLADDREQPELKLWDPATGKELRTLEGYAATLYSFGSLAFSPDGSRVAGSSRESIRVWEADSGKRLQTFPANDGNAWGNHPAFSPDGRCLAMASGKTVRLWDLQTGKERAPAFEPHTEALTCVAFTPDGEGLVAGAVAEEVSLFAPPTALVWEVKTGKRIRRWLHRGGVHAVAVSPDGKSIASAGDDSLIRVWDVESKKEKWTLHGHTNAFSGVAFHPGGRWLFTCSYDGSIKVWDTAAGRLVRTLRGHTLGVTGLALPADGRRLVSSGEDGTVRVWEWDRDQDALTLPEPLGPVLCLAFHPDGRHLAAGSAGVSLWDIPAGKVARRYGELLANPPVRAVAFDPQGGRLATASAAVQVWDTAGGKKLFGPQEKGDEENGIVNGLAFRPDGRYVAARGERVTIRDAATGGQVRSMGDGEGFGIAYSPDGHYLASGKGRVVTLWDAASGEVVRTFPEFPDTVLKVSFSPVGHLLAASSSTACVWEHPSGREVLRFRHASTRTPTGDSVRLHGRTAFSADGQRLAVAPLDGTVALWDVTTGQQILSLNAPGSQVAGCVAFSTDGHWLAAGGIEGDKGILRVWDARPLAGDQE
jgi:WD40 repeat protein/predicted Ser/Thr protein kinase